MSEQSLLQRCAAQLKAWHEHYGKHQPRWLPPAGDVRLLEDIDAAIAHALPPSATAQEAGNVLGPHLVSMAAAFQTQDKPKFLWHARQVASSIGAHGKYLRNVCNDIESETPPVTIIAHAPPPQPVSETAAQGSVEFRESLDELWELLSEPQDTFDRQACDKARANVERLYALAAGRKS